MTHRRLRLLLPVLFLLSTTRLLAQSAPDVPIIKLRIDLANARGGTASQIFSEVKYIPLETTRQSLFGKIDQLEVTNDYFIILDHTTDAILFFSKEGKFRSKISSLPGVSKRQLPGADKPIPYFGYFSVNVENNTILVRTGNVDDKLFVFDFNGKQQKSIGIPAKMRDVLYLKDRLIAMRPERPTLARNGTVEKMTGIQPYGLFLVGDSNHVRNKLFPLDLVSAPKENEWPASNTLYPSGIAGKGFYSPYFDYNLYQIGAAGVEKHYQFVFPLKNSLPPAFLTDSIYMNKRNEMFDLKGVVLAISSARQLHNNLALHLDMFGSYSETKPTILYSLKTGSLISLGRIAPDSSSCLLPLFSFSEPVEACDGNYFYTSLSSLYLFGVREQRGDKTECTPALQAYFTKGDKKDNPVIVQLKPRDDL